MRLRFISHNGALNKQVRGVGGYYKVGVGVGGYGSHGNHCVLVLGHTQRSHFSHTCRPQSLSTGSAVILHVLPSYIYQVPCLNNITIQLSVVCNPSVGTNVY